MFPFFTTKTPDDTISIYPVRTDSFERWYESRSATTKSQITIARFTAKAGETIIIRNEKGELKRVYYGVSNPISSYDIASLPAYLHSRLSDDALQNVVFELKEVGTEEDTNRLVLGWGLGCYHFDKYKTINRTNEFWPVLKLPEGKETHHVINALQGVFTCRNLINEPPNKLGPQELVKAAQDLAKKFKADCSVIQDKDLLKKNYPMVFTVGDSSERRPALVDIRWGDKKHPMVTLVGKGVVFDTGGVNVKPGESMKTMKKDMGGAAHVLGLAHAIMLSELPIRLRVLVPAVENAISGRAFRPDDVYPTRKGITVEIENTDAEGRLILSDCLYEGSSEKPEIIIDFATLTGHARIATGYEIPPFFANKHELEEKIKKLSFAVEDPVWPLPLWKGYRKELNSDVADICHIGKGKAGHITAALFLQEFIEHDVPWLHFDVAAWSYFDRAGHPKGGTDMGLRTIFEYLRKTYK
ncbi:MAG: leucyl aminopeptidase [Micavibrio sp.]|nr:leucyl aminopeptidase [Micavibrio sp.]|tara:strand:- start:942 stop:2351 length:1410 start_codon:yes stop_codon:yes gene_type:complete